VEAAIQPRAGYRTPTALVVLENSHNLAGGRITPPERMAELVAVAREHDLPVHLDGARIHNSAAALGISAAELSAGCDTVMFCLSKGLSAPVGSILAGTADTIVEARRVRKMFGGGMRQAGIIAAAGLVAFDEVMPLLAEDNRRAHELAVGLADIPAVVLDPDTVETNIVFFSLAEGAPMDAGTLAARLGDDGLLCHPLGGDSIRMVTHYHISDEDIERAVEITTRVLSS